MSENFVIEPALSSDKAAILDLLTETELPHDGVSDCITDFLTARDDRGRIVACAGFERHANLRLLRSVAVAPGLQKSGIGSRLVERLIIQAKQTGIDELILLTTTARDFFAGRFGFVETTREEYDANLARSAEWTLPRCSSAVVMKLKLT